MTLPEVLLWQALRTRPNGLKFRKQHPAGAFVLDFYCASARLTIEVDGEYHADPAQIERDRRRDAWLASRDVRVLRVPAAEILKNVANVVEGIVARATFDQPLHRPAGGSPPRAGEDR